jgi:hypothetical protein
MKKVKLEDHPMYLWLREEKGYNFFAKFNNYLPKIKEYELSPKDHIKLLDEMHFFLMPKLQNNHTLQNLRFGPDRYESDLMRVCNYIKEILPLDPNKKSLFWYDRTVALMDQFKPLSDFFNEHYPEIIKNKAVKKIGDGMIEDLLLKNSLDSKECLNQKKLNDLIDFFDDRFSRYGTQPVWEEIMGKYPSLFFAVYSTKHGYELKPKDLQSVFDTLNTNNYYHSISNSDETAYNLANIFAELVANSLYFKNTLAPTKNLSIHMQKFFKAKVVEDPKYSREFFANYFFNHKLFEAQKMQLDLSKHERLELMGKVNLSKSDYEIFEEKMQAQRLVKPKTKKIKL